MLVSPFEVAINAIILAIGLGVAIGAWYVIWYDDMMQDDDIWLDGTNNDGGTKPVKKSNAGDPIGIRVPEGFKIMPGET